MNWNFFQRYDESWIWRCADRHVVTESSRNFAALQECIDDAARHGYASDGKKNSRMTSGGPVRSGNPPGSTRPVRTR